MPPSILLLQATKTVLKLSSKVNWSLREVLVMYNVGLTKCGRYKNTKASTCVKPLMKKNQLQLNVLCISTLIRPLVKTKLAISVATTQAAVARITRSYSCTYRKACMAKQEP